MQIYLKKSRVVHKVMNNNLKPGNKNLNSGNKLFNPLKKQNTSGLFGFQQLLMIFQHA